MQPQRQRQREAPHAPGSSYGANQQKRRDEALARQRASRLHRSNVARLLHNSEYMVQEQQEATEMSRIEEDAAMAAAPDSAQEGSGASQGGSSSRPAAQGERRGLEYARQMMHPEWLTDTPPDLATHWLVCARPEGQRCLVATSRGKTAVRGRSGSLLVLGHSGLPEGGPASQRAAADFCLLDAVWYPDDCSLYVVDALVWRGYSLMDCSAEFRAFWLKTKLEEDLDLSAGLSGGQPAALPAAQAEPHTCAMATDIQLPEPEAGPQQQQH